MLRSGLIVGAVNIRAWLWILCHQILSFRRHPTNTRGVPHLKLQISYPSLRTSSDRFGSVQNDVGQTRYRATPLGIQRPCLRAPSGLHLPEGNPSRLGRTAVRISTHLIRKFTRNVLGNTLTDPVSVPGHHHTLLSHGPATGTSHEVVGIEAVIPGGDHSAGSSSPGVASSSSRGG